jgi:catechol 2,3-dioxygenase-like lactoylglutathione lyase family enzyme
MTHALSALGQIALTVSNIDAAIPFYRDQLGLPFLFAAPPKLAFFDLAGIRLMLSEPEAQETLENSTLYFKVDDIQATYETLRGRGVVFEESPHLIATMGSTELWMAFFRDPSSNLLSIMSEIPVNEPAN